MKIYMNEIELIGILAIAVFAGLELGIIVFYHPAVPTPKDITSVQQLCNLWINSTYGYNSSVFRCMIP